jgi:hypothetical protein
MKGEGDWTETGRTVLGGWKECASEAKSAVVVSLLRFEENITSTALKGHMQKHEADKLSGASDKALVRHGGTPDVDRIL